jgi:hypothetical protein
MARKSSRMRFWTILAIINFLAMVYPIGLYLQAENNSSRFVASVIVLSVAFLLAIMDTVSAVVVYMGDTV